MVRVCLFKGVFLYGLKFGEPEDDYLDLAVHAYVVAERSKHILVPWLVRDTHEFAQLVDKRGVYAGFVVVKRGKPLGPALKAYKGCRGYKRTAELNMTIPFEFNDPELGCERLAKCVRCTFLNPKVVTYLSGDLAGNFFKNPGHFQMKAITNHRDFRPTDKDMRLMRDDYDAIQARLEKAEGQAT